MKTSEKIAVMQAFDAGMVVEMRVNIHDYPWTRVENPTWNWQDVEYRIASPEWITNRTPTHQDADQDDEVMVPSFPDFSAHGYEYADWSEVAKHGWPWLPSLMSSKFDSENPAPNPFK